MFASRLLTLYDKKIKISNLKSKIEKFQNANLYIIPKGAVFSMHYFRINRTYIYIYF